MMISEQVQTVMAGGTDIRNPQSVHIDESVDPSRISPQAIIHPGCRIYGVNTTIGPGSELGQEGPVTIEDCQLADKVILKGGYFSGSTMLSGVTFGSGAHVRPGTLLEEQSSCAHSVGLKQTVLLPFVTLGSLVNFCDCLMAGGTSGLDHSEVGSSYIHFNYTPHQDKATPSLIGDVARGVMLDCPPIFLGGQGGLVGPSRIDYGTIIAAGTVYRRDVTTPGTLVFGQFARTTGKMPYQPGLYGSISRIVENNLVYIGNIVALREWYRSVRTPLLSGTEQGAQCAESAIGRIDSMVQERLKRMGQLAGNMKLSLELAEAKFGGDVPSTPFDSQKLLEKQWPDVAGRIESAQLGECAVEQRDILLTAVDKMAPGTDYPGSIKALTPGERTAGTAWLQAIVDTVRGFWAG
ncbi:MAG: hypothetical protein QGH15_13125 [Kiritimatiellia bacterium]|jgi:UDP-N-acetylglucosamine/UDP-N-acetylgalactosamine diphosphorylase|nr:hypothetical protein [Kiritimatiellia bacterium]